MALLCFNLDDIFDWSDGHAVALVAFLFESPEILPDPLHIFPSHLLGKLIGDNLPSFQVPGAGHLPQAFFPGDIFSRLKIMGVEKDMATFGMGVVVEEGDGETDGFEVLGELVLDFVDVEKFGGGDARGEFYAGHFGLFS